MAISHKELINLPVYTKSDIHLGYIAQFEIDELSQKVTRYVVNTHKGIAGLFKQQLFISPQQVVHIDRTKMVVEDLVLKLKAEERTRLANKITQPAGQS